jgi:hypothetical protein
MAINDRYKKKNESISFASNAEKDKKLKVKEKKVYQML